MNKTIICILEIGGSGLIGMLITIGYQYFSMSPETSTRPKYYSEY